jgi:membrane protease subunit HflC
MSRIALGGLIAIVVVVLIIANAAIFTVHQQEQALVLQLGEPRRIVSEPGLHFKLPLIQNVQVFDKRVLDFDAPTQEIPTNDQKRLLVDAFAKYRIVDTLQFFQTVRDVEGARERLAAIISAKLRDAFGGMTMQQLLTDRRAQLMAEVTRQVKTEADDFGITVLDVRVKRVDLPKENSDAVYGQMRAQRNQEARRIRAEGQRDKQTLEAEGDKTATVTVADARRQAEALRGEGDAEATRIYNEAYGRDPKFFDFYRSMQALRQGLPHDTTTFVGPPSGDFFRFFGSSEGVLPAPADGTPPSPPAAVPGQTSSAGGVEAGSVSASDGQ